jgi:hypothetical protein
LIRHCATDENNIKTNHLLSFNGWTMDFWLPPPFNLCFQFSEKNIIYGTMPFFYGLFFIFVDL